MKRVSDIYSKIYEFENLHSAYLKARRNKRYRNEVLNFTLNLEENLIILQNELIWKSYKQGEYREFEIYIPKLRHIKALPFKDRVLQHALNNLIEPILAKGFSQHSYACMAGKGLHKASDTLSKWVFNLSKEKKVYCLKCDVRKYFDNVDLRILYSIISKKIKDRDVMELIYNILELDKKGKGLPIENLTSQLFANLYLNELDKFVKQDLKVKRYIRYMDDFLILSADKKELHEILERIVVFLEENLKLELNNKTRIFPAMDGINFVGYMHYIDFKKTKKQTWQRQKKSLKIAYKRFERGIITFEQFRSIVHSLTGHLKHSDSFVTKNKIEKWFSRIENSQK